MSGEDGETWARRDLDGVAPRAEGGGTARADMVVCRSCGDTVPSMGALLWHLQRHLGLTPREIDALSEKLSVHRRAVRRWDDAAGEEVAKVARLRADGADPALIEAAERERDVAIALRPVQPHGIELRLLFGRIAHGQTWKRHDAPFPLPWEKGVSVLERAGGAA